MMVCMGDSDLLPYGGVFFFFKKKKNGLFKYARRSIWDPKITTIEGSFPFPWEKNPAACGIFV